MTMRVFRNPKPLLEPQSFPHNQRRHGRVMCEYLSAYHGHRKFGDVVDLSSSGLRACRKGFGSPAKGDLLLLTLRWNEASVPVKARVCWVRKTGFLKQLIGVQFENVSPSEATAISHLAQMAQQSLVMASTEYENGRNRGAA